MSPPTNPASAGVNSNNPYRSIVAPLALTMLVFTSVGLLIPLTTTTIVDELKEPKRYIGYAIGALTVGALIGRILSGALVDRFGTARGLRIASITVIISGALYAIPTTIPSFLVARALHGLGEAMVYTCAATMIVNYVAAERRGRFFGLLGSAVWGGLSLGPALSEVITRAEAAGLLIIGIGVALLLVSRASAQGGAPGTLEDGEAPRRLRPTMPRPAILPGLCVAFYNLGYAAITGFLIVHLRSESLSPKHALSFYAFAVLFGRLALGGLPDRLGPRPSLILGISAMFIALGVIAFAPSLTAVRGALILFGLGYSMPFPALASVAVDRTSERERASTIATLGTIYDVFVFAGSIAFGWMADAGWLREVFFVGMGGIACAFALAMFVTSHSQNRYHQRSSGAHGELTVS